MISESPGLTRYLSLFRGTASTMNALAEALGMALPGSAAIPAAYRERGNCAYETGKRIVELVQQDIKPSDILTRAAFENAIALNTAIGGSTNAPIHLNAIARHVGVKLDNDDWEKIGYQLPLLVNVQPAGEWLCEEYFRAGGLPAVAAELLEHGALPHPDALTVSGKSIGENVRGKKTWNEKVIKSFDKPLVPNAGFLNLKGSLFSSAIMKTSVISDEFRKRYLSNPKDPDAFESPVAVFDGPEEFHRDVDSREDITELTTIVMRGTGPLGYPGAAEVVRFLSPFSPELARYFFCSLPASLGKLSSSRPPPQKRRQHPPLHRRRPPKRHIRLSLHPQRLPRSRRRWQPRPPTQRRHRAHRPPQTHRRHPPEQRRARAEEERVGCARRVQGAGESDAVAGVV
jgi:hypothetical protein